MLSDFRWGGHKRFWTQVFLAYRFTSCPRYLEPILRNVSGLSHFGGHYGGHFWAISRPNQLVQGPTSSKESNGNPFSVLIFLSDQGDGKNL